jgi:hypothetical protein
MARPRKNRLGEYARLLGEEIGAQLSREVSRAITESQRVYHSEIAELRAEIRGLERRIETLSRRATEPKPRLGKWVPGGPGRPPKDADARIAAFEARARRSERGRRASGNMRAPKERAR